MGKKNRASGKSPLSESTEMATNPFGDLELPGLPRIEPEIATDNAYTSKETLHVRIEKKGRRGKTVTVIEGFEHGETDVASRLKGALGVGGGTAPGVVELQGDCRQKAGDLLRKWGYALKGI